MINAAGRLVSEGWMAARQEVDSFVAAAHVAPRSALKVLAARPGLVERRASWGETALQAASHLGHQALAWRCIEAGASIDLFAACALGDMRLATTRFDQSIPDARGVHGLPLLHFAVVGGNLELLTLLIDRGVAVNPPRAAVTPLHSAVAWQSMAAIRRLLDAGADAQAPDPVGATPLDWAADLDGADSEAAVLLAGYRARERG